MKKFRNTVCTFVTLFTLTTMAQTEDTSTTPSQSPSKEIKKNVKATLPNRDAKIAFNLSAINLEMKTTPGTSSTKVATKNLTFAYGWNHGHFEWGPTVSLSTSDIGGSTSDTQTLGFSFDWNFMKNSPQNAVVAGLSGTFGISKSKSTSMDFQQQVYGFGLFIKSFLNNSVAILTSINMINQSGSWKTYTMTTSGTAISSGFIYYF